MSDAAFQETARARRRQTYFRLNSHLAQLDNQQLYGLLAGGKAAEKQNRVVKLGSTRIFVKRVPVTYLEYIHMHSTANYYDLPSYFNFGGGGGGLGVFREIATHIKTTNWVLGGEIGCFPLLYHWRIMPRCEPRERFDEADHQKFVRRWNGNKRIDQILRDKFAAPYEVLLLLECNLPCQGIQVRDHSRNRRSSSAAPVADHYFSWQRVVHEAF